MYVASLTLLTEPPFHERIRKIVSIIFLTPSFFHRLAEECFELGRLAYVRKDYYHTLTWMQAALDAWDKEEDKSKDRGVILDYLAYATSMVGIVRVNTGFECIHCMYKETIVSPATYP